MPVRADACLVCTPGAYPVLSASRCVAALKKQFAHVRTPATERSDFGDETPGGADDQWTGDSP